MKSKERWINIRHGILKSPVMILILALVLVGLLAGSLYPTMGVLREMRYRDKDFFDVIVVGGEPEGVAAAVSAARNGANTLLLESRDGLGGLMTYGMLNSIDMNFGPDGDIVTKGIFQEFYRAVQGDSFDVEEAKVVFRRLVEREPRLYVLYNTRFIAPVLDRGVIRGVRVSRNGSEYTYYARRVIDATQDGDVAAASGVPYTWNAEDRGLSAGMAPTLVLHIGGVDWDTMADAIRKDRIPDTGVTETSAWGFWPQMRQYKPQSPRIRVRAPNIGRQRDGSVLINAVLIFGVDSRNPASRAEAIALVEAEAPYIVDFMRQHVPGFGSAYFIGTAPELYIRESRHTIGEYILTVNDVLENRYFPDTVAVGSYPVDIQASGPDNWGFAVGKPIMYGIPFRSLVPLKVDNLMVVGRAASFTSLAAGSARVIPVGMATGEAAGVAAVVSLRHDVTPRQLAYNQALVSEVQQMLKKQGAYVGPFNFSHPMDGHWANPAVRVLRPLGLVSVGYSNNYQLDELIKVKSFMNLTWEAFKRRGYKLPERLPIEGVLKEEYITPAEALWVLERVLGSTHAAPDPGAPLPTWLGSTAREHLGDSENLQRALAYTLLADALHAAGIAEKPLVDPVRVDLR